MLHRMSAACVAVAIVAGLAAPMAAQQGQRHKVVVISLDAFGAESLHDPNLPAPTLRLLMNTGAYATAMRPINPTVTWPNHTAMITGVNASKHHVLVNGLVVNQRENTPPKIEPHTPKTELVGVPTVYDAAHKAGLTTAEVDWVAIEKADGITWRFTEYSDPNGTVEKEMMADGDLTPDDLSHFNKPSQAWRDRIYTLAAADIIKKHHPDLLLFHLLALDSIEHQTGYGNNSGINTISFLDDRVRDVIEAVREAGDLPNTSFLIVSDHGQMSVHHHLDANLLLKQSGLQGSSSTNPTYAIPEGGFALVYQKHATPESTAALKKIFTGKPGVRAVLDPVEATNDGWPVPANTNQAPDLLIYAENGYAFAGANKNNEFVAETKETGAHGYPNTEPLMKEIFIASGAGIAKKGEIAEFDNIDIAPTIARLLQVQLPNIEGKELKQIFTGK